MQMKTAEHLEIRTSTWRTLLVRSAAAQALAYAVVAAILTDPEAAVVAVGSLVGIGLLRFRKGTLGLLELGGLFAYAAYWMVPAAMSNLSHSEGVFETAVPTILSLVALTGTVAAIATVLERRAGHLRGARVVTVGAIVLLAASVALASAPVGQSAVDASADASIKAKHVKFSSTKLEVAAGRATVSFANDDLFWHTFTIRELGVDLRVPVRAERTVAFNARPGTYEFVCAIPGHAQAGMKGTLIVR
jgi:plastocyanin